MLRNGIRLFVILLSGLGVAGCYTDFGPVVTDSVPVAPYNVASHLQPGDQLKVIVYGEDALSGLYEISPAGAISMPLIGPVMAAGHTRADVERAITSAYIRGQFLKEPKITVSVITYRPFYVLGEVLRPGQFPFASGLNVLTAIATAGGFTYRASRTDVLIRHPGEEVWQQYSLAAPLPVVPGDLIRVPERYF